MEEEKPLTHAEMAAASQEFLQALATEAKQRKIPLEIVVALLGLFSKAVVEMYVDNGISRDKAINDVVTDFMGGLGITVMMHKVKLDPDAKPYDLH